MSGARWCDYGAHAFKEGAPGSFVMQKTQMVKNQWGGEQASTSVAQELCPECAALVGMNDDYVAPLSPRDRHAAIEDGK